MSTGGDVTARGADVMCLPPPLLFAVPFGAGVLLHQILPWRIGARPISTLVGAALLAAGIALVLSGVAAVHRAGTTIVPHHPVSALLTNGPYALSRNPMYTGLAIAATGGALIAGTWWPVALLPASVTAVRQLVIGPEERYLATQFGSRYTQYRSTVRRWL